MGRVEEIPDYSKLVSMIQSEKQYLGIWLTVACSTCFLGV